MHGAVAAVLGVSVIYLGSETGFHRVLARKTIFSMLYLLALSIGLVLLLPTTT